MDNNDILTDLDIFFNGVQVEELKQIGPEEAGPYIQTAGLAVALGQKVELRFGSPEVYALAALMLGGNPGLSVTLRDA